MKLNRTIANLYNFSSLREVGKIGATALLLVILVGAFAKFFLKEDQTDNLDLYKKEGIQYLSIDPVHVKEEDEFFRYFLESIKSHNGVLVLGTSESGFMDGYNYWELLNADDSISQNFSVLYGAGRSCERYIPSIVNNPKEWKGLEVLVFINPVYWRDGLERFNSEYHERYQDYPSLRSARKKSTRKEDFDLLFGLAKSITEDGVTSINLPERIQNFLDNHIHKLYYNNLRTSLGMELQTLNHFTRFNPNTNLEHLLKDENLKKAKNEINVNYNCTQEFIDHEDIVMNPVIPEAAYRNLALEYFIDICKRHSVKVQFIVGPYNKVLAEKNNQTDLISRYEQILKDIRTTLKKEGMPFIEASDVSSINQTFIDKQHHAKYGGYLIYQRIKEYWNEKVDD